MAKVDLASDRNSSEAMPAGPAGGRVLARPSTSLAPRIVVLGGGFAGVTTALELARECAGVLPVHVTLLSDRNFFLFTPMLAEAATGAVETRHVLYPIRPLCGKWGVEFGEMHVERIDLERGRLVARHHRSPVRQQVHYDKLVLALGATPNVAIAPGAEEHALTFKSVAPRSGRAAPADTRANDAVHWHTMMTVPSAGSAFALIRGRREIVSSEPARLPEPVLGFRAGLVARDPDGHAVRFVER